MCVSGGKGFKSRTLHVQAPTDWTEEYREKHAACTSREERTVDERESAAPSLRVE